MLLLALVHYCRIPVSYFGAATTRTDFINIAAQFFINTLGKI